MKKVCLDANIWIKVLTEESDSKQAQQLVMQLFKERSEIIAPAIMKMEVGSILRKKWCRHLLSQSQLHELWNKFLELPIRYVGDGDMYAEAWRIAESNQLAHLYDAVYLAISGNMEFWTADERLVNSVKMTNVQIKLLSSSLSY